jgi:energy-coupling factor transporter ATP-binding protein EcfA2
MSNVPAIFTPAVREKLKARVAIDGPTGSGKTYTALQWARILVGEDGVIGVIDTERRSAAYYAPSPGETAERINFFEPPYEFGHYDWEPPYDPANLTRLLPAMEKQLLEQVDGDGSKACIVLDSWTHFWTGEGGTLDQIDRKKSQHGGNSFAAWSFGTPLQRSMVDAILAVQVHVIATMRSKMAYVLEDQVDSNGRKTTTPTKKGMEPEQRAGIEYEFTVIADMDLDHRMVISKSRCNILADRVLDAGHTHEAAIDFRDWLGSGVERISPAAVKNILDRMDAVNTGVERDPVRTNLKRQFAGLFGKPHEITTDRLADAIGWLDANLPEPPDSPPDRPGSDEQAQSGVLEPEDEMPPVDEARGELAYG